MFAACASGPGFHERKVMSSRKNSVRSIAGVLLALPAFLLGQASTSPYCLNNTLLPGINSTRAVALLDVDGDGDLDIVAGTSGGLTLPTIPPSRDLVETRLVGPGRIIAPAIGSVPITNQFSSGQSFAPGNFVGSPLPDVIAEVLNALPAAQATVVSPFTNAAPPAGNWVATAGLVNGIGDSLSTHRIGAADFNQDGALDVAASTVPTPGSPFSQITAILNGVGAPTFVATGATLGGAFVGLRCGDVTGDSIADIVVATAAPELLVIAGSSGGFVPATPVPLSQSPLDLALADLNNAGALDVVFTAGGVLGISLSVGAAGVTPPVLLATPYPTVGAVATADLDNDGQPEILVGELSTSSGRVAVFSGFGTAYSFSREFDTGLVNLATIETGDLDGDGAIDAVVGAKNSLPALAVLFNDSATSEFVIPVGFACFGDCTLSVTSASLGSSCSVVISTGSFSGPVLGGATAEIFMSPGTPPSVLVGGCPIVLDLANTGLLLPPVVLNNNGDYTITFPIPVDPGLAGTRFSLQALVSDGINSRISNGIYTRWGFGCL